MQEWLVPIKTFLIWLLVAVSVVIICHLATTANAQQIPEVIEPGPLLFGDADMPSDLSDLSDLTAESELIPIAESEDSLTVEMCETAGPSGCESPDGTCFWARWLHSTCDMPQHHAYFPPLHGYYYFRPYHPGHLTRQQRFVKLWGGDARHPYANHIFKTVYAQYDAERQAETSSQTYRLPPAPKVSGTRK